MGLVLIIMLIYYVFETLQSLGTQVYERYRSSWRRFKSVPTTAESDDRPRTSPVVDRLNYSRTSIDSVLPPYEAPSGLPGYSV